MIYDYFHNLFLAVDQLINTIIGGDPDETFSSRVGKCQRGDYGLWLRILGTPVAWAINVLFVWQGWRFDHCQRCIEDDEGGRELVLRGRLRGVQEPDDRRGCV